MILLRIAWRNLGRHWRKNLVVAVLIATGIAAFFLGNAVLEGSVGGIQQTFSESFTADLSLSASSDRSFSLFGPDVPVIGEYDAEPLILNAAEVGERAAGTPGVAATAYVLSSPVVLEEAGRHNRGLALGVIGDEYFSMFRDLAFTVGAPPPPGSSGWAVLTEEWAGEVAVALGHPLAPGDKVQLSLFRSQSFTIREATLAGIIRYQPGNDALRRVVIADGRIVRALCGYSQSDAAPAAAVTLAAASGEAAAAVDVDSLFSGRPVAAPADRGDQPSKPVSVEELKKLMTEAQRAGEASTASSLDHGGAWHFILVRTKPGADKGRVAAALRLEMAAAGLAVQVRDWRATAGGVATYVFLMQVVMYVGIFMVGGIVLILTMNSLVMSVFERTGEIGTMRAIGARRGFIRSLFVIETGALTLISGIVGIATGAAAAALLDRASPRLGNQILILLFGGTSLHPVVTVGNIAMSLFASLVLGTIAWMYPVRLALRIEPVRAVHKT